MEKKSREFQIIQITDTSNWIPEEAESETNYMKTSIYQRVDNDSFITTDGPVDMVRKIFICSDIEVANEILDKMKDSKFNKNISIDYRDAHQHIEVFNADKVMKSGISIKDYIYYSIIDYGKY